MKLALTDFRPDLHVTSITQIAPDAPRPAIDEHTCILAYRDDVFVRVE